MAKKEFSKKESPEQLINRYQKGQKALPFMLGILAALLVILGIAIIVIWASGSGGLNISLFATKTPTATATFTPTPVTPSPTASMTPTDTPTPEPTITQTPSGPFAYKVLANDNCWDIAAKFEVPFDLLLAINNFGDACPIVEGQDILIPAPGQEMPTSTPLPSDIARGTQIEYTVELGDTLLIIASKFNTTVESLREINALAENATILFGQKLKVRVNLVTPTPTRAATLTPRATILAPATATVQPTP